LTGDFCCVKSATHGDCCEDPELRFKMDVDEGILATLKEGPNATPPENPPTGKPPLSGHKDKRNGGLGVGGYIGLGIGATILAALLAFLGNWIWRGRRNGRMGVFGVWLPSVSTKGEVDVERGDPDPAISLVATRSADENGLGHMDTGGNENRVGSSVATDRPAETSSLAEAPENPGHEEPHEVSVEGGLYRRHPQELAIARSIASVH
jgi:hypothetical protein